MLLFVLRGGRLLVFVDPLAEQDQARPDPERPGMPPKLDSNFEPLFGKWGIKLTPDKVVGDLTAAVRVTFQTKRGPQDVEYLPWMQLQGATLNHDDFITNELNSVNVGTAGSLEMQTGGAFKYVPLLQTETSAGLIDRDAIIFVKDPAGLIENFKADNQHHVIATRVTGVAETAFPNGRPRGEEDKAPAKDHKFLAKSATPINVIVVADTDVLADRFWVRFTNFAGMRSPEPFGNNGDFLINAIDSLGGNEDLIGLRSRGQYTRPFEVVQSIQREAEAQFRERGRLRWRQSLDDRSLARSQRHEDNSTIRSSRQRAGTECC